MTGRIYGYARVSSTDQNLTRQLEAFKAIGIDERDIFSDKKSGKDFNRDSYRSLVGSSDHSGVLREGDMLVIYSIDRLGRNYEEIRNQWHYITKEVKADIKVLDMPLLDTTNSRDEENRNNLDSTFVADLVLQILSYVAEKERRNNKDRQAAGIAVMEEKTDINGKIKKHSLKTGRAVGRPAAAFPKNWEAVYKQWKSGQIKAIEAMKILELKKVTFYNLVKRYEEK